MMGLSSCHCGGVLAMNHHIESRLFCLDSTLVLCGQVVVVARMRT